MARRSDQLRGLAEEFCRVHRIWVEDANRPNPDEIYWDAATAMLEAFDGGDIPADCRDLADAVEEFGEAFARFDNREDVGNPYPAADFWAARESLESMLQRAKPVSLPPLETVPELRRQGVTDNQIATMYGFTDREGRLMPQLVQRELDKPGSVLETPGAIDGRNWVDPRLAERSAAETAAERHSTALAEKRQRADAAAGKPCKETPQELWAQGVGIKQAAKMLQQGEADVAAMFEGFEAERQSQLDSGETQDALTQEIMRLASENMRADKIASQLGVERGKVEETIKRQREIQKARAQQPVAAGA